MRVGLYLKNDKIKEIDLSRPQEGNPGIGGTQYNFVTMPWYFNREIPGKVEFIIFAHGADKLPETIKGVNVAGGREAVEKAAEQECDIFIFRPTDDRENFEIIEGLEKRRLKSIAWAHSDVIPQVLDALNRADMIKKYVCVARQQYNRHSGHPIFTKSTFIVNGFDPALYKPETEVEKAESVVYLGNLIPAKGFHYLARVWPAVNKFEPDSKLVVIGNASLYNRGEMLGEWGVATEEYEARHIRPFLSDENGGIHSSVSFAGLLAKEKIGLLQSAAVGVVNPSAMTENCPGCAIEFSAAGTAVVSKAAMGLLDTVVNGKTGLLGNSLEDLAKNIIYLLRNRDKAVEMGRNGIEFVEKEFSYAKVSALWFELFSEISE